MRGVPGRTAEPGRRGVVQQDLLPLVAQVPGDGPADLQRAGRVRIGGVEDARAGPVGDGLDERGEIRGGGGVDAPDPPPGQEQGRTPVQHPLHDGPFTRRGRPDPVDLRRPHDADGQPAFQHDLFGGDFVGAVSLARAVVDVGRRREGRLVLGDRRGEVRRHIRVDVVALRVGIHGATRNQHGGTGVRGERQQRPGVGGGEAETVDEQIGTGAECGPQLPLVGPVRRDELRTSGREFGRHPRRVPPDDIDLPPAPQQPQRGRPSDESGSAEDEGTRHEGIVGQDRAGELVRLRSSTAVRAPAALRGRRSARTGGPAVPPR